MLTISYVAHVTDLFTIPFVIASQAAYFWKLSVSTHNQTEHSVNCGHNTWDARFNCIC